MSKKVITCASFGGTGSSAITDLLKEFDTVVSLGSFEFMIAHEVDGVSDLEHYLVNDNHRLKVDEALYRFKKLTNILSKEYSVYINNFEKITNDYVESLIEIKWDGYWHRHPYRYGTLQRFFLYTLQDKIQYYYQKYFRKSTNYEFVPYFRRMETYYSNPSNFYKSTKKYYSDIVDNLKIDMNNNVEYVAMDQLVPPVNVERYLEYFDNLKVICVDRDPRDLYTLNKIYWKEGWIPSMDPYIFSKWFRAIRKNVPKENSENVLRIKFEDLVYNYEESLDVIYKFLGIPKENHIDKLKYFNPNRSIKNTKVWLNFKELESDIKIIEENLSDFCYEHN